MNLSINNKYVVTSTVSTITLKPIHNSKWELINDCALIVFVCGTVGIALKFVTYFNQWVYFPTIPNALDSTFLILAVGYFVWRARNKTPKHL
jgi:hypothetical protein